MRVKLTCAAGLLKEELGQGVGRAVGSADAPLGRVEVVEARADALGRTKGQGAIGDDEGTTGSNDVECLATQVGDGLVVGELEARSVVGHGLEAHGGQRRESLEETRRAGEVGGLEKAGAAQGGKVESLAAVATGQEVALLEQLQAIVGHEPTHLILVLVAVKGAGAVDEQAAGLECGKDGAQDVALALGTLANVVEAPLAEGHGVLAEHTLAGAGNVGEDEVERIAETGEFIGEILGHHNVGQRRATGSGSNGAAPLLHVLGQHLSALAHGLVRDEQTALGQMAG